MYKLELSRYPLVQVLLPVVQVLFAVNEHVIDHLQLYNIALLDVVDRILLLDVERV
jgi:hypothetical protein